MEYRPQYFKDLWTHSYLSLRINHEGSCKKSSNCSNKIKMPKSTTGCRIRSFIPIEKMSVERCRAAMINPNKFSQVSLKWTQKSAPLRCSLPPTLLFFCNDFCKLLITAEVSLIDSWSIYKLMGKLLTQ